MSIDPIIQYEELNGEQFVNNSPWVSVWCVTYNHVSTIKSALDGFLKQKTDFDFEIVIFDDASTDGTSEVIREYAKTYPKLIHAFIMKTNTYANPYRRVIAHKIMKEKLHGKYIALCEGDDFWIDHEKLAIQAKYMENNEDCSLYIHNALWFDCVEYSIYAGDRYDGNDEMDLSIEDIILQPKGHPATASFFYRKKDYLEKNIFYSMVILGDYALQLYLATKGKIHYSNRIMSVYREFYSGSISSEMRLKQEVKVTWYLDMIFLLAYYQTTLKENIPFVDRLIQNYVYAVLRTAKTENVEQFVKKAFVDAHRSCEYLPLFSTELTRLQRLVNGTTTVENDLRTFISDNKQVFIMGTGKYSDIIVDLLEKNDINFEGFAVSNKQFDTHRGKRVCNLSDIAFEDCGLIVAIKPKKDDDIYESLKQLKLKCFTPFYFDSKNIVCEQYLQIYSVP